MQIRKPKWDRSGTESPTEKASLDKKKPAKASFLEKRVNGECKTAGWYWYLWTICVAILVFTGRNWPVVARVR